MESKINICVSVKPEDCERIFRFKTKRYLLRGDFPEKVSVVYVYATKDDKKYPFEAGKIIGCFHVGFVSKDYSPSEAWYLVNTRQYFGSLRPHKDIYEPLKLPFGILAEDYDEYFKDVEKAVIIEISEPFLFEEAKELEEFGLATGPLNYAEV